MSALATDWAGTVHDSRAIYLTDMDGCLPADALSRRRERRHWRLLDYESKAFQGVMITASHETNAPDITYPLNVRGWHAISIGMHRFETGPPHRVRVKLTSDRTFSVLTLSDASRWARRRTDELFWKVADLTDEQLKIGQVTTRVGPGDHPSATSSDKARVSYIKLVPLEPEEVAAVLADRQRTDTRRLFAHNDAHGPHFLFRPTTAEEIRRELEPYRHSDFSRMYWECGSGDEAYFLSTVGRVPTFENIDDFERQGDRLHAESWRAFRDQGIDPFLVALAAAHGMGIEFHACYRPGSFLNRPPSNDHMTIDGWGEQHPQFRTVGREGRWGPRISFAYPETREFVIRLLVDVARHPIDGVCVMFNRRAGLLEYEPPIVESFREATGLGARELDPHDSHWLAHRATFLTTFMRELRAALDEAGAVRGMAQPIELGAVVMSSEAECLYFGLDLRAWIRDGLVDTLIPFTSEPDLDSETEAWTNLADAQAFLRLVDGTPARVAFNVMPRSLTPDRLRTRAAALYAAGAEHLFFWDCAGPGGRANGDAQWNAMRRLGHVDELEAWTATGSPPFTAPLTPLVSLAGWDMTQVRPG